MVPDLQHYYGIDLRDLFLDVPPWTPRFLLAHINNLDYNSAFVAQLRGGQQYRGWGEDRYIAASTSNAIRTLVYLFILANKDPRKKSKTAVPTPWPLPDDKDKKKKKQDKPGSFGFMAKSLLSKAKKRREGGG